MLTQIFEGEGEVRQLMSANSKNSNKKIVMKIQIRTGSSVLETVFFQYSCPMAPLSHLLLLQLNILVGEEYQELGAKYLHTCPTVDIEGVQEWITPVMKFFQISLRF